MSVYQKLNQARTKFHTLKLKKSGLNKFQNYSYFELSDFLIPALDVFSEIGLCAFISFGKELATMTITDIDDGSFIAITSPMEKADMKGNQPIQNLGAVETYTRRYLWVTALEIVEHDALDSSKPLTEEGVSKKGQGPVITPRGGIGDDISEDIKAFLTELAASTVDLVNQGKAKEARTMIEEQQLETDQFVWFTNQLAAPIRTALKNAK